MPFCNSLSVFFCFCLLQFPHFFYLTSIFYHSLWIFISIDVPLLFLYFYHFQSLSFYLSVCLSLYLSLIFFLSVCLSMFVSLCLSLYVFQSFLSLFVFYSLYSHLFFFILLSFYRSVFRIVFLPSSLTLCLSNLSQKTGEHFAAMTSANLGCEWFYWSS